MPRAPRLQKTHPRQGWQQQWRRRQRYLGQQRKEVSRPAPTVMTTPSRLMTFQKGRITVGALRWNSLMLSGRSRHTRPHSCTSQSRYAFEKNYALFSPPSSTQAYNLSPRVLFKHDCACHVCIHSSVQNETHDPSVPYRPQSMLSQSSSS